MNAVSGLYFVCVDSMCDDFTVTLIIYGIIYFWSDIE